MSYAIFVGRNRSKTGHGWLAGYGDEPSSHWLELVPEVEHPPGARIGVGVGPEAEMPGRRGSIAQVPRTLAHLRVSYSHYLGVPAPITNGGLNARGVAVRDVWSPSRPELVAMTPKDQTGPNYSDLARIVLERAGSARQAVEICAALIAEHGESTYGGNSHMFADADEAWVMIQYAGGKGLWVAERLGPDSIRVSRPGYVLAVPVDQPGHPDFRWSENFVSFAREMGWYAGGVFDANRIYGDGKGRWEGERWIAGELAARGGIGFEDLAWALRTERLTGDTAGYGQIVPLVTPGAEGLRMLWHCPTGAIAAPFAPVYLGQGTIPAEFGTHRYLTTGEDHRFVDGRKEGDGDTVSLVPQANEALRSAVAEAKRLMYLVQLAGDQALARVTRAFTNREAGLLARTGRMQALAETLIRAGDEAGALALLGYFSRTELMEGLALVVALAGSLEAELKAEGRLGAASAYGSHQGFEGFPQVW